MSENDLLPSNEDVALLMRRLAKAGWISDSAQVGGKGRVNFVEHGIRRMEQLGAIYAEIGDELPVRQWVALLAIFRRFADSNPPPPRGKSKA